MSEIFWGTAVEDDNEAVSNNLTSVVNFHAARPLKPNIFELLSEDEKIEEDKLNFGGGIGTRKLNFWEDHPEDFDPSIDTESLTEKTINAVDNAVDSEMEKEINDAIINCKFKTAGKLITAFQSRNK